MEPDGGESLADEAQECNDLTFTLEMGEDHVGDLQWKAIHCRRRTLITTIIPGFLDAWEVGREAD